MEKFEKGEKIHLSTQKASEADIQKLIELESSIPPTNTYSSMVTESEWKKELAEGTVELIKINDVVVGSIAYTERNPGEVYISGILVQPEHQGKGIATNTIKSVLAKHPDAARIYLAVHPDNPALKLYESLGFRFEERKENYFGDGEPRLILARTKE